MLKTLDLSMTWIVGESLASEPIRTLAIENLWLSCCKKITDSGCNAILSHCGNKVKRLDLSSTFITAFPTATAELRIEMLNLSSCIKLGRSGLADLARIHGQTLRVLDLNSTHVTGEEMVHDLYVLEDLNLSHCLKLTDQGLMNIVERVAQESLKTLNLSFTKITGEALLRRVKKFRNLRYLNLSACRLLKDGGLSFFLQICGSRMRSLNFSRTSINGEQIDPNINASNVCAENLLLDTSGTNLTDLGLRLLLERFVQGPTVLDLTGTKITGEGISDLEQPLKHLEQLILNDCKRLTDKGLLVMLKKLVRPLKTLKLNYTQITGESFASLDRAQIEGMSLYKCNTLTETGLFEILRSCGQHLKYLNLSNHTLTGSQIKGFASRLSLEFLNLFECKQMEDEALQAILSCSASTLKNLNLRRTSVTDASFTGFTARLEEVKEVSFFECSGLGDVGLSEFLKICGSKVQILDLTETKITGEGLFQLVAENSEGTLNVSTNLLPEANKDAPGIDLFL